jgi:hypothetical protein
MQEKLLSPRIAASPSPTHSPRCCRRDWPPVCALLPHLRSYPAARSPQPAARRTNKPCRHSASSKHLLLPCKIEAVNKSRVCPAAAQPLQPVLEIGSDRIGKAASAC